MARYQRNNVVRAAVCRLPLTAACALALIAAATRVGLGQSRIEFNGQQLFFSGSNIAWVNFAADLGPAPPDTDKFKAVFDSIHAHGGNALRFWLNTTGANTPQFNTGGRVIGPGAIAIASLRRICDLAWQRRIGLLLSLWSFDMLDTSNPPVVVNRAQLMLADTSYTRSYINNALIPMVDSLKGHPAIIAWEVFNEAEGMSNEFGWSTTYHVPMADIQQFVNLVAGAIHRVDPAARVTTGAWALTAETDVIGITKPQDAQTAIAAMTQSEKHRMEEAFTSHYGFRVPAEEIIAKFVGVQNYNYYSDARLIAAGGDPLGTLDFYTDHYYDWQGTPLSPFHHPYSTWQLTKPLVIAEFFPVNTLSIPFSQLYRLLYDNGYAGGMSWGWYSGGGGYQQGTLQANTLVLTQDLFSLHPEAIDDDPIAGRIYSFAVNPSAIDSGGSAALSWNTANGTAASLNDSSVAVRGTLMVSPPASAQYRLTTHGAITDTAVVSLAVTPSGRILAFTASPALIAVGDPSVLRWQSSAGSVVALNGMSVNPVDSLVVHPDTTTTYRLTTIGAVRDTSSVTVVVVPVNQLDRALLRPLTVSSSSTRPGFSNPGSLVDGDTTTQWASLSSDNQWIDCDLGQLLKVTRVTLRWGYNYATQWRIQLSRDHAVWSTVRTVTGGSGGTQIADSINAVGRYIILPLDTRLADTVGFILREFEVYGQVESSSVKDGGQVVPDRYALLQNYPNPFNPSTTVRYALPVRSDVRITISNVLGQRIAVLVDGVSDAGVYEATWVATVASGTYFCTLDAAPQIGTGQRYRQTVKLLLLR